jgi:hypothetical protein
MVYATMRQSHAAIGPWLITSLQDYLHWFGSLSAIKLPDTAWALPVHLTGCFNIWDFCAIATTFSMNDLFWETSLALFARAIPFVEVGLRNLSSSHRPHPS